MKLRNRVKPITKQRAKQLRKNPTEAEAVLWRELKGKKLDGLRFRRQSIIRGWIADFYCPAAKLVIEVDGSSHVGKEAKDAYRDKTMIDLGLKVVRVTNQQVLTNMPYVLALIRSVCFTHPSGL